MYVSDWDKDRVRKVREALGLTPVKFANVMNTAPMTAYRWEKNGVPPYCPQIPMLEALEKFAQEKESKRDKELWQAIKMGAAVCGAGFMLYKLFSAAFGEEKSGGKKR